MIPVSSIIFMLVSGIVCLVLPIILYLLVRKKPGSYIGVFIGGALSFYISQMIIRIPILQLAMPKLQWYSDFSQEGGFLFPYGFALFLGLSAALFETGGRLLTLNFLLKKRLSYRSGIIHGLGHGGIEAFMLLGLNYIIYVIFSIAFNGGSMAPLGLQGQEQELLSDILLNTESYMFLVAGLERVLTIIIHVALSLLITVGIVKGQKLKYSLLVIAIHTGLDAGVVIASTKTENIFILEGIVVMFALVAGIIIYKQFGLINTDIKYDEATKAVDEGY